MFNEQTRKHHEALTRIEVSLSQVRARPHPLQSFALFFQVMRRVEEEQLVCEGLDAQLKQEKEHRLHVIHKIESSRQFLDSPGNENTSGQLHLHRDLL